MYQDREEILQGTVCGVIFQNTENGYTVLRLRCEDGETVTVVGIIPMTVVGERLLVTGRWNSHPSHGRQFEAEFLERLMPETENEIRAYLSSRVIKGIGAKTADAIVKAFGRDALNVMEQDPDRLAELPGISARKATEIGKAFRQQIGVRRLMEFLSAYNLPPELAMRLYRIFGVGAEDELRANPYLLAEPYFGASFADVDQFALELGLSGDDERRVESGILFELTHNLSNGHTFLPRPKLIAATAELLSLETELIEAAADRLLESGRMEQDIVAGLSACYLPHIYEAETDTSHRLVEMASHIEVPPRNLERMIEDIQRELGIVYADEQKHAIRQAACNRVLVVTGGPGTGKTTTLSGILQLFDQMELHTQLAAPTGRAAKRLSELTGSMLRALR